MRGFLARFGVPNAEQEDKADDTEGEEEPGPHAPVFGGDVTEGEGLDRGTQVDESVDDTDGGCRAFTTAEIHGGGAGQQAVRADDAEGHHEDQKTEQPAVAEGECHHDNTNRQQSVQKAGGGSPSGLEQFVAHNTRQIAADDACDHENQSPVMEGEVPA